MGESIAARKLEFTQMQKDIEIKTIAYEIEQIRLLEIKILDVLDLMASVKPYTMNGGRGIVTEDEAVHKMSIM